MDLSDLTAFCDHSFCSYSSCLNFTTDRSVNNGCDLFDHFVKVTAFFCDQRWICGNTTDNSHIICLADIIYICCVDKKLHEIILLLNFPWKQLLILLPTEFLYLYYSAWPTHVKQISASVCHIFPLYMHNNAFKIYISRKIMQNKESDMRTLSDLYLRFFIFACSFQTAAFTFILFTPILISYFT